MSSVQGRVSLQTRRSGSAFPMSGLWPMAMCCPLILVFGLRNGNCNGRFGFVCYGLGARGTNLCFYALALWLPVFFVVVGWKMHYAPQALKPSSSPLDTNTLGLNG